MKCSRQSLLIKEQIWSRIPNLSPFYWQHTILWNKQFQSLGTIFIDNPLPHIGHVLAVDICCRQCSGLRWRLNHRSLSHCPLAVHSAINTVTSCWAQNQDIMQVLGLHVCVCMYCHIFGVCVTNNNGLWISWLVYLRFFTITINYDIRQQWLSATRSVPYWTTSVFSSAVTDLVLIYESVTYSASVGRWLTLHSWTLNYWTASEFSYERISWIESESFVTTDGQSASLSWNKAPIWGLRPDLYFCLTVAGLLISGALSDDRPGLSFTIPACPRQRSHFLVRVP
jgi:hypothetical protein